MLHFVTRLKSRLMSYSVLTVALLISMASPAFAQMNIEITGVGQSLYPIAVMRFKDENKLPTSVTEIIRQDLARSGYFKNTETVMRLKAMKVRQTINHGLPVVLMLS